MKQKYPRLTETSLPLFLYRSIILLFLGLICSGCVSPKETRAPKFPNIDIVFVASSGVGFVNADGSNPSSVNFSITMPGNNLGTGLRPIITGNNNILVFKISTFEYRYMKNIDPLALWRTGEYPILCTQWGEQEKPLLSADQSRVFIHTEKGMAVYTLSNCGQNDTPVNIYNNIIGIPSPDMQYVAFDKKKDPLGDDRLVMIRNLTSKEEQIIGTGDYPAWSRDGHWLAYTGPDGIYVVNITERARSKKVISYTNPVNRIYPSYYDINDYVSPEVSWSPDSKWLVYHRKIATGNGGDLPSYYALFKVNVETGEESKIVDKGMYPYWRWPAQP